MQGRRMRRPYGHVGGWYVVGRMIIRPYVVGGCDRSDVLSNKTPGFLHAKGASATFAGMTKIGYLNTARHLVELKMYVSYQSTMSAL